MADKIVLESKMKAAQRAISLDVHQSGMVLTVEAGTFRMRGVDYEFTEVVECVVTADADDMTHACGYLVKHKDTGDPSMLLDEVVVDGEDSTYLFNGDYELLHMLFHCTVPAAAADLDSALLKVFHIVESEGFDEGE